MKLYYYLFVALIEVTILSCIKKNETTTMIDDKDFKYQTEQFADLAILRYQVPGFEDLSPKQKELVYYLYEAALSGRDIIWDQNYKYNLKIKRTLEAIVESYNGDKNTDEWNTFMVYTKRVWFSNGIHHHYSNAKFQPEFSKEYFAELVKSSSSEKLPLEKGETIEQLISFLTPILFDPKIAPMRTNLKPGDDLILTSANNFYEGVTQKEVESFYSKIVDKKDESPVSYGLNSKLVKESGTVKEKIWKVGGMYSSAIEKIVFWLEKAIAVAETENQRAALQKLVEYYKTGDLNLWDEYNILWVKDTDSRIDVVNGFIETYNDALNYRANFESIVSFRDLEATKRIEAISSQAQWFEDNSPIMPEHKKKNVKGVTAKVITVVVESGDASPSTPIGINLPNANWIRKEHGSKSVNLGNIVYSYNKAASEDLLKEFCYSEELVELHQKYASLSSDLHTDMHEVIGHGSGQINPGVGTPRETLKNYASTIEEARADLVALYYVMDQKLIDIGVMPSLDVGKAEYNAYIRNGLMLQLARIKLGDNIEQAHMRDRQLISLWAYQKGIKENVIEKKIKDGKTYFVINDYQKLRALFGELLKEVQRISSEGDFKAAQNLVETYGVKIDQNLHKEVLERYNKLNIAPYRGFINPVLAPVMEDGKIIDVKIEYPDDFTKQMLYYSKKYSFLPTMN
jgi:dipeptidyl-peptidase-3